MSRPGLDERAGYAAPDPDALGGADVAAALDAQREALAGIRALLGPRSGWIDADLAMRLGEASEEVANRLLDLSEAMARHARDLRRRTPQSANSNLKPSS